MSPKKVKLISRVILSLCLFFLILYTFTQMYLLLVVSAIFMAYDIVFTHSVLRCPACGKSLGQFDSKFCPHCGEKIDK